MHTKSACPTASAMGWVVLGGLASLLATTPASAAGSFAGFAGHWRGGGTITMNNGTREKVRCKGTYAVRPDNRALSIDLKCASDSYKVNVVSNVTVQGAGFSGQWQELTRSVQGDVTGSFPGPGQMSATLGGPGFSMGFAARASGNRQSVVLKPEGTDIQSVEIALSR